LPSNHKVLSSTFGTARKEGWKREEREGRKEVMLGIIAHACNLQLIMK
jgi:hypothetical protein